MNDFFYRYNITDSDFRKIIEDLRNDVDLKVIAQKYHLSDARLKNYLRSTPEGEQVLEELRNKHRYIREKKISSPEDLEELKKAYKSNQLDDFTAKHNVSKTTAFRRLKEEYGDTVKNKKEQEREEICNKLCELYKNGFTIDEISKIFHMTKGYISSNINSSYIKIMGEPKPKMMSKTVFEEAIGTFSLEQLKKEAKNRNMIIPKKFIDEYQAKNQTTTSKLESPNDDEWER